MAKFYLGQRVRAVRCDHAVNLGNEGTITHIGIWHEGDQLPNGWMASGFMDVVVMWDRPMYCGIFHTLNHCGGTQDQLEPLTPPHVAGSWEVIEQLLPNIREGVAA